MAPAGQYKRKQPETETHLLTKMENEIHDIVKHHGQVPTDEGVLTTYKEKVLLRNKLQQHILKTTTKPPAPKRVKKNLLTITGSRDITPPCPCDQTTTSPPSEDSGLQNNTVSAPPEDSGLQNNAVSAPTHHNHYLWSSPNGVLRDLVSTMCLPLAPLPSCLL